MGREYARIRLGIDEPRLGLLSNGEEAGKGDDLRKARLPAARGDARASSATSRAATSCTTPSTSIVTDGFTGNVALKTVEGAIRGTAKLVFDVLDVHPELQAASAAVMPALLEAAEQLDPDYVGGCVLLGVDGVCVIAHGSSNALAIEELGAPGDGVRRGATSSNG